MKIEIRLAEKSFVMNNFYNAVGMDKIAQNKRGLNRLIHQVVLEPSKKTKSEPDSKNRVYLEYQKNFGASFGVCVYGYSRMRKDREGNIEERIVINDWRVFACSGNTMVSDDYSLDYGLDGKYYCFFEENSTNNLFEFAVNNLIDCISYLDRTEEDSVTGKICANVALLSSFGTVILPVSKVGHADEIRMEEDRSNRELLEKAKKGDQKAEDLLNLRAQEMAINVRERLKTEDLLSVFEGYFLSLFEGSGIFNVLADIEAVERCENSLTGEKLIRLSLCITGSFLDAYISEKNLLGLPTPGMRFMGMGILQGSLKFLE